MRVAFLLKDLQLSGGVGVVLTHARNLAEEHGFDVTLVTTEAQEEPDWQYDHLAHLHVLSLADASSREYDVAVSTWWETAYQLFLLRAERYASFVQSLEDRFYATHESVDRLGARASLDLPVAFITEAGWIAEQLADLRPDSQVHLVRNGIDKETFPLAEGFEESDGTHLRVLVEGSPESWFKGVPAAIRSVEQMAEPHKLTLVCPNRANLKPAWAAQAIGPLAPAELCELYSGTDVLLKLSHVEGMYGPPLEAFHRGATCVTTEVTGHEEFIRHGENALVCDWDDERGTAAQLDMLARDRKLLRRLRTGALETARNWPDWSQSSSEMAAALRSIAGSPPPSPSAGAAALTQTLSVGVERERGARGHYRKTAADAGRWRRFSSLPGMKQLFALRRWVKRVSGRELGEHRLDR